MGSRWSRIAVRKGCAVREPVIPRRETKNGKGCSNLESTLILLGVLAVEFLHDPDVLLEISNSMLPCLQAFCEKTGCLYCKSPVSKTPPRIWRRPELPGSAKRARVWNVRLWYRSRMRYPRCMRSGLSLPSKGACCWGARLPW
jgi:hypothetical protein